MSLHLRKQIVRDIAENKLKQFPSLDHYESRILDIALFTELNTASLADGFGYLSVIATELLELARRADPAYGLTGIPSRALESHDKHAQYEFPTLCKHCRAETEPSDATVESIMGDSDAA